MGNNAAATARAMEKIRERYPEEAFYAMMNLVGSHDTTRILSYLDGIGDDRNQKDFNSAFPTYEGTSQLAKDRQYLVAFLQFTYAGAPTIYYGDEIGMVGSDDPDDRRAFEWGKGNQELVEWYARLAAIRAAYPALRTGSVGSVDMENNNLLAFVRQDAANTVIVIANNARSAQTANLDGSYVDLITGEAYTGTVPALSGVILVAQDEVKTVTVNTADLAPAYDPDYIVKAACDGVNHNYVSSTVDPTCTEDGSVTYTCGCGHSYTEILEATGHRVENGECTRCHIIAGWSGYTIWTYAEGVLTVIPSGQTLADGQCNMRNYWKQGGVLTLPWDAYADQITTVVIEEGVHAVGQMAFYGLANLKSVTLPDSLLEIRDCAFKGCTALADVILPDGLVTIGESAFYKCESLTRIAIPASVRTIGDYAFAHCTALETVSIDGTPVLGEAAFKNVPGYKG
jgi:hypothetical protein